jgi:hypothetical protein
MQPLLVEEMVRDRLDEIVRLSAEESRRRRMSRRAARARERARATALLNLVVAWFGR